MARQAAKTDTVLAVRPGADVPGGPSQAASPRRATAEVRLWTMGLRRCNGDLRTAQWLVVRT